MDMDILAVLFYFRLLKRKRIQIKLEQFTELIGSSYPRPDVVQN